MKFRVDIKKDGTINYEVLERAQGENCGTVSQRLVQGMRIQSEEVTGPDCDEVHESMNEGGSL